MGGSLSWREGTDGRRGLPLRSFALSSSRRFVVVKSLCVVLAGGVAAVIVGEVDVSAKGEVIMVAVLHCLHTPIEDVDGSLHVLHIATVSPEAESFGFVRGVQSPTSTRELVSVEGDGYGTLGEEFGP